MELALVVRARDDASPEAVEGVLGEVQALAESRDWWVEPFGLVDDDGLLTGGLQLMLLGYEDSDGDFVDVDPDEDSFMAFRDLKAVIRALAQWSTAYSLEWDLSLGGDPIGAVHHGAPDRRLTAFVRELGASGEATFDETKDEARARTIHLRHALRRP